MKKHFYFLSLFLLSILYNTSIAQRNLLFFGRAAGAPSAEYTLDIDLTDSLEAWGYTVTYASTLPNLSGYDGIFISETIGSSDANNFADGGANYPIPCVNLEGWTARQDRWGWVNDNATEWYQATNDLFPSSVGEGVDGQFIVIEDNSHYITHEYTVGQEVQWANATEEAIVNSANPVSFKEVNKTFSDLLAKTKVYSDKPDFWTMITIDSAEAGFPNRLFLWGMIADAIQGNEDLPEGRTFHYSTQDFWNIIHRATDWTFGVAEPLGTNDKFGIELQTHVYPNPANELAHIRYYAKSFMRIKVTLHSIIGQEIDVLKDGEALAGYNFVDIDASNYPSGVYFIQIVSGNNIATEKLIFK